jgi:hypothetical protein
VAGYPTSGKSTVLWKAVEEGLRIFGPETGHVVPSIRDLAGVDEDSAADAKMKAGLWLTLADLPFLNGLTELPRNLVLHLDLLLSYLLYRDTQLTFPTVSEAEQALAKVFEQPAINFYGKITVTTLYASFAEVRERWSHRWQAGLPANTGALLAEKDTLFREQRLGRKAFDNIYAAWERQVERLRFSGRLELSNQLEISFDIPPADMSAPHLPAPDTCGHRAARRK